MKNYQAVNQWLATVKVDQAHNEMTTLKLKYPWLKCDLTLALLTQLNEDLPKYGKIVQFQDAQIAILNKRLEYLHEFIRVSELADEAIVNAVAARFNINLDDNG